MRRRTGRSGPRVLLLLSLLSLLAACADGPQPTASGGSESRTRWGVVLPL
ncbi:MAG: hypothetical protein AB7N54_03790 [Alphaproteobacteria bacterium]